MRKTTPRKRQLRCSECGKSTPAYNLIHYGSLATGYRELCTRCYNTEVAEELGLENFQHIDFEPIRIVDRDGRSHEFHFNSRLCSPGVAIDAFELRRGSPGGYRFQAIGDPEDDQLVLLGRLVEKIRRALSVKHLENGEHGLRIADHQTVRARIAWDDVEEGQVPLLIIDGREITWYEFGRMLMTYEGWQFKLEIRDKSEEL